MDHGWSIDREDWDAAIAMCLEHAWKSDTLTHNMHAVNYASTGVYMITGSSAIPFGSKLADSWGHALHNVLYVGRGRVKNRLETHISIHASYYVKKTIDTFRSTSVLYAIWTELNNEAIEKELERHLINCYAPRANIQRGAKLKDPVPAGDVK